MKNIQRYWPLLVGSILIIPTLFLMQENFGRGLFISLALLSWILVSIKTKKVVLASLLFTILVLPFNITLLLPESVNIFGSTIAVYDPYVIGLYSNYLIPTISILDLFIALILISFIFSKGFKYIILKISSYRNLIIGFLFILIIQNIFLVNFLSIFNSIRFITYLTTLLLSIKWIKSEWKSSYFKYFVTVSIFLILIQGIIGILQFNGGSSLGLTFIGESQVVNGMQGSSFISLNDGIYLRAYGTFPHPNVLGGFYILMFVIGWISSLKLKKSWKYLSYLLMFLSLIFVLFTFSRISISLVILGVLLFSIQFIKPNRIFSFSPILIFERFMNLFAGGDTSWNDRVNLFKAGMSVFKENFLLGTGSGNFIKYMGENAPRTSNGILLLQPVHNVFLLSFVEFGLVGGILYWIILIKILIKEVNWKENIWIKIFILMVFVIVGMFDHYLFTLPQGMVIGMLLIYALVF